MELIDVTFVISQWVCFHLFETCSLMLHAFLWGHTVGKEIGTEKVNFLNQAALFAPGIMSELGTPPTAQLNFCCLVCLHRDRYRWLKIWIWRRNAVYICFWPWICPEEQTKWPKTSLNFCRLLVFAQSGTRAHLIRISKGACSKDYQTGSVGRDD